MGHSEVGGVHEQTESVGPVPYEQGSKTDRVGVDSTELAGDDTFDWGWLPLRTQRILAGGFEAMGYENRSKLTDEVLLKIVLEEEDRLRENSKEAFCKWQKNLSRYKKLTSKQREWVEDEYFRLELDHHEPKYVLTREEIDRVKALPKLAFELMPKPIKPPGVRS